MAFKFGYRQPLLHDGTGKGRTRMANKYKTMEEFEAEEGKNSKDSTSSKLPTSIL